MGAWKTALYAVCFGIVIYFIKQYVNGGACKSTATISGKVVIVTGANTGIGKETVADLVRRGGKVYMACRSTQRCSEARQDIIQTTGANEENIVCAELDLGSTASIRAFVAGFVKDETQLDILINNAGVLSFSKRQTADGFEPTFGVNHLGHFLLTNLLTKELIAAAPSRVVTVSSAAHAMGSGTINLEDPMLTTDWSMSEAYAQSKLANILFSTELGRRLRGSGVTTYSLHPGTIITDIGRDIPYLNAPGVTHVLRILIWPFLKDSLHGAQTQICCAVDENLAKDTGKYYEDCVEVSPGVPAAFDGSLAKKLWDLSMKLLSISDKDIHQKLL